MEKMKIFSTCHIKFERSFTLLKELLLQSTDDRLTRTAPVLIYLHDCTGEVLARAIQPPEQPDVHTVNRVDLESLQTGYQQFPWPKLHRLLD